MRTAQKGIGVIQQKIHQIWSRELDLAKFSDDDDFFDLGGHSLIMAKIQDGISDELGVEIPMDELFRESTVNRISTRIESSQTVS
jgi:acyl carrier protein